MSIIIILPCFLNPYTHNHAGTGVYTAYADTENDTANATASSCGNNDTMYKWAIIF